MRGAKYIRKSWVRQRNPLVVPPYCTSNIPEK